MSVERQPSAALDRKQVNHELRLSAYGKVQSALSTFQTAIGGLKTASQFNARKATLSDGSLGTAVASATAAAGTYGIEVQTLAQAQKLKSGAFSAVSSSVGTGSLTIQFGTYSGGAFTTNPERAAATVTIGSSSSSLAGVRDAINAAKVGVIASIVNDGSGNRLILSSELSGVANALKVTVSDADGNHTDTSGLSQLAYDAATGGTQNLTQTVAAQNATLLIDGVSISKASNSISDAIEGVTLTLAKAAPGTPATLNVTKDGNGVKNSVDGFVKAYNALDKTLRELTAFNQTTKQAAALQGDANVRTLQARIRSLLSARLEPAAGGLSTLGEIGVSFQRDGSLALDAAKLDKVLSDPSKDIATLFAAVGKPGDSLVSFGSATTAAKAGSYALSVTQLATRGFSAGSAPAALTINAGVNDTLNLTVDGTSATTQLAAGTYTAAALAAEIQSKVNGALLASGKAVTATQAGGVLTLTSNSHGSASSVTLTGGNGLSSLFGAPGATAGVDAAGTLGDSAATGAGQTLSALGLSVRVTGGALGARGTLQFARGVADQLDSLIADALATSGPLEGRKSSLNAAIDDIGDRRLALARRLELVERRYRTQFTALDTMIASMNQTSGFLAQQIANLPKAG